MDSTASNNFYKHNVTEEKAKSFDLSKVLINLMWEEPFYSRIIRSLNKKETNDIPTAGVLARNGDFMLYWNRYFLSSLSKKKVFGLLKHECLHLVYNHTTSRRRTPHTIWNWATDLAINSQLENKELPKGGLIPGQKLPPLRKEDLEALTQEEINQHNEISNLIESLERGKTSEFYFNELQSNEAMQKMLENQEKFKDLFKDFLDDHEGWDELSDEDREILEQEMKKILKDAVNEANEKGWGSCSASLKQEIMTIIHREISWEKQLRRFCGYNQSYEKSSSVHRLNRKYPTLLPGKKYETISRINVYVDESGSVSSQHLEKFYGELNSLSKHTDFYFYKFDTSVDEENSFLWEKGKQLNLTRTRTGGTNFNAPTKHANSQKKKPDGYIIFTDGYAPKPLPSRIKRGWVITPDGSIFDNPDSRDFVINLK